MAGPEAPNPPCRGEDGRPAGAGGNGAKLRHRLRGPVDAIQSAAQALWRMGYSPEQHCLLWAIRRSTDEVMTVVNDILDAGAIEAGRIDLIRNEFNLRDCVADTLGALRPRAEAKGFGLGCEVDTDVPNILFGDPGRLRQVISSLVDNAIHFTERGLIGLSVRTESQSRAEAVVHFRVSDTGVGILPETQGQVFSMHPPAGVAAGAGTGLAVAAHLVERMGGRIWADSETGRGSRFHFTARFELAHEPVAKFPSVGVEELSGLRALIVTDGKAAPAQWRRHPGLWGMECVFASRGWRALEEAHRLAEQGTAPAVVLLDTNLPDVDAFTLAERFAGGPKLVRMPVIVLSAAGLRGDAARCQDAGVAAYLSGPVARTDLRQAVCACVASPGALPWADRLITRHSLREDREFLLILLATDKMIDRELARLALGGWGHKVVCVAGGDEAAEALARRRFDLVLTDTDLPAPDGFALAGAVRRDEQTTGAHLPLLAMTPHASDQDRRRCLDAGFDGCVTKPLHTERLLETVHAVAGVTPPAGPQAPEAGLALALPTETLFDEARALAHAGGDRQAMARELEALLNNSPLLMAELRRAITAEDAPAAWRGAHILRTAVATCGAAELVQSVERLEQATDRCDLAAAGEAMPAVEQRMSQFAEDVASAIKEQEVCRY